MIRISLLRLIFDPKGIEEAAAAAASEALIAAAAYVRRRARSSMRQRKAVSAPGSPPSAHNDSLKNLIFFSFEPSTLSVVIGATPYGGGQAPRLLEFGGTTQRRGRTLHYRPRPYMKPALDNAIATGRVQDPWKDSIRAR